MALADSEKQPPPSVDNELVILLRPEPAIGFIGPAASAPPQIVASINAGESPGGLGEVKPSGARLAIKDRVRGRMAKWIEHNWDTPTGRLQRYLVFTYPEETDADEAADVLKDNPNVEGVSRNVKLRLHAIPSDDFVGDGTEDPEDAQWGVHLLNLPAAWDWVTGHSTLGFIDEGLETQHFDLRATHEELGFEVDDGGAFRAHLSRDVLNDNCSVDEMDPADGAFDPTPGHGSHTMGIAAASTDNELGVAGTCWNCSVMMTKAFPTGGSKATDMASAAQGLDFLARRGAQSVNMSFGVSDINIAGEFHCGPGSEIPALCDTVALADLRDVVMVASSGNDRNELHPSPEVDYPAADPRTIAVGGLELDPMVGPVLWVNECAHPPFDCGSWIGPSQDLMAPAQDVLSTVYTGFDHIAGRCGDSLFPAAAGLGLCTGTSMSAPFVTGEAGLVRTANPLLDKEEVRDVLTSTASIPGTKDPELGHGIPDAEAAVKKALGRVSGATLKNRLTPLFAFHSPLLLARFRHRPTCTRLRRNLAPRCSWRM